MSKTTINYRGAKGELDKEAENSEHHEPEAIRYRGAKGELSHEKSEKHEREVQYRGGKSKEEI